MKISFDIFKIKSSNKFDEKLKLLELEGQYYKNYLNHLENKTEYIKHKEQAE